jgi:hypothetical protein
MKSNGEKRSCTRCNYKAPMTCACFNSDRFYRAKTTNHSRDGIFFLSNFPLQPGAHIFIRMEKDTHAASAQKVCACGAIRYLGLAEVKWCHENINSGGAWYTAGLKYYQAPY